MSQQNPDGGVERRQVEEVREGFLEGVGILVLSAFCGLAVFLGLGAWFLVSKAYPAMGVLQSVGIILLGAILIAGGVYGFYKL